jgi:hypothetical protein
MENNKGWMSEMLARVAEETNKRLAEERNNLGIIITAKNENNPPLPPEVTDEMFDKLFPELKNKL